MFNTPILLLIFNRPHTTQLVFDQIKLVKPKYLYVAGDGPRNEQDVVLCQQTREIINQVNWECEVKLLFREKNMGCGKGVYEAINWFFETVKAGIILEDDILPDVSFFDFCSAGLNKYKDTENVLSICGTNFLLGKLDNRDSCYFSTLNPTWGWATWKRSWEKYDYIITDLNKVDLENLSSERFQNKIISKWAIEIITNLKEEQVDVWDCQFLYLAIKNNVYSLVPTKNLVKNIGFVGTHFNKTENEPTGFLNMKISAMEMNKISYPKEVKVDYEIEKIAFSNIEKYYLKATNGAFKKVLNFIKSFF